MKSETNSQLIKRLRAEATENGLCYVCRCRPHKPGRSSCQHCLDLNAKYRKTPRGRRSLRRYRRNYERQARANAIASGMCIACKNQKAAEGRRSCSQCLRKSSERSSRRYWIRLAKQIGLP